MLPSAFLLEINPTHFPKYIEKTLEFKSFCPCRIVSILPKFYRIQVVSKCLKFDKQPQFSHENNLLQTHSTILLCTNTCKVPTLHTRYLIASDVVGNCGVELDKD